MLPVTKLIDQPLGTTPNRSTISSTSPLTDFYPIELFLGLLSAVAAVSLLIAWLPYMMNINASQTVRTQAILSERSRLSREIHDGVAQSLGIVHWKVELLQKTIAAGKSHRRWLRSLRSRDWWKKPSMR